ncbi:MAG: hypothetical protein IJ638_01435 [Alphaproteobacteria bacterium]|nr:hypothetical protein [Alphaproteobacteria bacterium]
MKLKHLISTSALIFAGLPANASDSIFMCTSCPPNSTSKAGALSISDCKCNSGYEKIGNRCYQECDWGQYRDGESCRACRVLGDYEHFTSKGSCSSSCDDTFSWSYSTSKCECIGQKHIVSGRCVSCDGMPVQRQFIPLDHERYAQQNWKINYSEDGTCSTSSNCNDYRRETSGPNAYEFVDGPGGYCYGANFCYLKFRWQKPVLRSDGLYECGPYVEEFKEAKQNGDFFGEREIFCHAEITEVLKGTLSISFVNVSETRPTTTRVPSIIYGYRLSGTSQTSRTEDLGSGVLPSGIAEIFCKDPNGTPNTITK